MSSIQVLRLQTRMLRALLNSPSGTASICDATDDLSAKFGDGGKWRGPALLELAKSGFIRRIGATNSRRRRRHSGLVGLWQLSIDDRSLVRAAVHHLERRIDEKSSSAATDELTQLNLPFESKENDHGKTHCYFRERRR